MEHKSDAEIEPSDALSCTANVLADDIFNKFHEALEQQNQASPSSSVFSTDKHLENSQKENLQEPTVCKTRVWTLYRETTLLSSESEGEKCDSPRNPIYFSESDANTSFGINELCEGFSNCYLETAKPVYDQSTCPQLQFADGKTFFETVDPLKTESVTESIVISPCKPKGGVEYNSSVLTITSVSSQCVQSAKENLSFEDILVAEASKVAEDIFNASQELDDIDIESDSDNQPSGSLAVGSKGDSQECSNIDEAANPFVTQSSLRRSPPPPPGKQSPRSSKSRGHSPSKMNSISAASIEPVKEQNSKSRISCASSANSINYAEVDDPFKPRTKIQNSPPKDLVSVGDVTRSKCTSQSSEKSKDQTPQQKSVESSPRTAPIGLEVNSSEAGPDIADDQFQSGHVFKDPFSCDFPSTGGDSRTAQDLRKESLYVKFDPLVGTVSQKNKNMPLPQADLNTTQRKCERTKSIIQDIKNYEEVLKASLAEYDSIKKDREQKYDMLKSHATTLLESVNQELDSLCQSQQAENSKLKENLKEVEIKVKSLEEKLEQ